MFKHEVTAKWKWPHTHHRDHEGINNIVKLQWPLSSSTVYIVFRWSACDYVEFCNGAVGIFCVTKRFTSILDYAILTSNFELLRYFLWSKVETFRGVSDLTKTPNKRCKLKRKLPFNINNSILKNLNIIMRVSSAKVQCSNLTLTRKL